MTEHAKASEPKPEPEQPKSIPFTGTEYRDILVLAAMAPALIFWTHGADGAIQPLLMPVHPSVLQVQ